MELIQNLDNNIVKMMKEIHNSQTDNIMLSITKIGNTKVAIIIIALLAIGVLFYYYMKSKKNKLHSEEHMFEIRNQGFRNIIYIITTTAAVAGINRIMKYIIQRPRPNAFPELLVEKGYSFPSGHSMIMGALTGILVYYVLRSQLNRVLKYLLSIIIILIGFLVAFSRVYLGVHYLSDIIVGITLGYIIMILITIIFENKFKIHKT